MSFNPNEGGPEFASKVYGGLDQQAVGGVGGNAIVTHDIGRQYVGGKRRRKTMKMSYSKWGGRRSKKWSKKWFKMGGKRRSRKMRGGCGCAGGTDTAAKLDTAV